MATRRFDPRIVELDDLNPTKHIGNVITWHKTKIGLLCGFLTFWFYYARLPMVSPLFVWYWCGDQYKHYFDHTVTKALVKKRIRDGAWQSYSDNSWPHSIWAKKMAFLCQSIIPFALGALLARRLTKNHISPAIPRPPTPAPARVTPKGITDTRVH